MMMRSFLAEAERMTDTQDQAQGVVRLTVVQIGHVFGYIDAVSDDTVTVLPIKRLGRNGDPIGADYQLHIHLPHLITARYADLDECSPEIGRHHR